MSATDSMAQLVTKVEWIFIYHPPLLFSFSINIKCVTRSCERNAHLFRMLVTVVNAPLKELFAGILERAVSLAVSHCFLALARVRDETGPS